MAAFILVLGFILGWCEPLLASLEEEKILFESSNPPEPFRFLFVNNPVTPNPAENIFWEAYEPKLAQGVSLRGWLSGRSIEVKKDQFHIRPVKRSEMRIVRYLPKGPGTPAWHYFILVANPPEPRERHLYQYYIPSLDALNNQFQNTPGSNQEKVARFYAVLPVSDFFPEIYEIAAASDAPSLDPSHFRRLIPFLGQSALLARLSWKSVRRVEIKDIDFSTLPQGEFHLDAIKQKLRKSHKTDQWIEDASLFPDQFFHLPGKTVFLVKKSRLEFFQEKCKNWLRRLGIVNFAKAN